MIPRISPRRHAIGLLLAAGAMSLLFFACAGESAPRMLERAREAFHANQPTEALEFVTRGLSIAEPGQDTLRASFHNLQGLILHRQGRTGEAAEAFLRSLHEDPALMEPAYNLGVLYSEQGDLYRAETHLEDAGLIHLDDPLPLEFAASLLMDQQRWRDARKTLLEALERAPGHPGILTRLALVARELDGPEESLGLLMQALERDPDYPPALFNLGVLHDQDLGQREEARAYFGQYLDARPEGPRAEALRARLAATPDDAPIAPPPLVAPTPPRPSEPSAADAAVSAPPQPPMAERLVADAESMAATDPRQALSLFMRAAALVRDDPARQEAIYRRMVESCPDLARAHLAYGRHLENQDRPAEALQAYRRAVKLAPDSRAAHLALAPAAAAVEDYDTALVSLRQAIALDPGAPEPQWQQARLFDQALNMTNRAIEAYRSFRQRFPDDPRTLQARDRIEALLPEPVAVVESAPPPRSPSRLDLEAADQAYQRGRTFLEQGDLERAIYHYNRAIQNNPALVNAYYNLGLAHQRQGDLDRAAQAYRDALERRPDQHNARYNLALVQYTQNQPTAAIRTLQDLVQRAPGYAAGHYLLGMLYAGQPGRVPDARRHYTRFVELQPADPLADQARRWLQQNIP